jgi:rubrerythrin
MRNIGKNIFETHPYLQKEWDFDKNVLDPLKVTHGTEKRAWWVCSVCSYSWSAFINNRAHINNPTGCPACSNKVATNRNSFYSLFPDLVKEWDYDKNSFLPSSVVCGSHKVIQWVCSVCEHRWATRLFNRTIHKSGCPACAKKTASHYNNISLLRPDLIEEWDFDKNSILPTNVSLHSKKKVWWLCKKCGYSWASIVKSRTGFHNSGCPFCAGKIINDNNRFSSKFPELVLEWDYDKNSISPDSLSFGSEHFVWWKCIKCKNEWKTKLNKRTGRGDGCPICSGSSISKVSQRWLDTLGISKEFREVSIRIDGRLFKVDAYIPETNTIYEFLGDFWHGNPLSGYRGVNTKVGIPFVQLYENTMWKIKVLKDNGYNVIYIWEKDFEEMVKKK